MTTCTNINQVNQTKQTHSAYLLLSLSPQCCISNQHFQTDKKMGKFYYEGKKDYKMNEFFPPKRVTGCTTNVEKWSKRLMNWGLYLSIVPINFTIHFIHVKYNKQITWNPKTKSFCSFFSRSYKKLHIPSTNILFTIAVSIAWILLLAIS